MAHELPPLPYAYDALESTIDKQTMTLHHDMHHGAYVKNLNAAIEKHPELAGKSAEDLIRDLNAIPEDIRGAVRNNGGGHVNHTMFWKIMKPKGGGDPTGPIAEAIQKALWKLQGFSDEVQRCRNETVRQRMGLARRQVGRRHPDSVHTESGQPDLARPVPHLRQRRLGARLLPEIQQSTSGIPHAWWNVVNWDEINKRFAAFKAGKQTQEPALASSLKARVGADAFVRPASKASVIRAQAQH